MGTFDVAIDIGHPSGQRFEPLQALVDTGATYTVVPAPILERLGVPRHARDRFVLAAGRGVDLDFGHTWVRVDDRTVITLVVFGEPHSRTLLGAYTLEGVRLAPDPVRRRLVPVAALLLACAAAGA
jgi:predicted aspartyl protease